MGIVFQYVCTPYATQNSLIPYSNSFHPPQQWLFTMHILFLMWSGTSYSSPISLTGSSTTLNNNVSLSNAFT
eukprot:scaffold165075_cov13-Prasinocladus_malaysianus.AAC.1